MHTVVTTTQNKQSGQVSDAAKPNYMPQRYAFLLGKGEKGTMGRKKKVHEE